MLEWERIEVQPEKSTIISNFTRLAREYAERPALKYKASHYLEDIPYKRLLNLVACFGSALAKLGLERGDRVVILSENRPEWIVTDMATQSLGAIVVPVHKVLASNQIQYIINEVEPKLIVLSNEEAVAKISKAQKALGSSIPVVHFEQDAVGRIENGFETVYFLEALRSVPHGFRLFDLEFERRVGVCKSDDVVTIIYTSGTTGKLKGVELTAYNFVSNVEDIKEVVGFYPEDRFLSILPLSHAFERTAGYYVALFSGASIEITDLANFSKIVESDPPTLIAGVPRFFEKVAEKITRMASENPLEKRLFNLAIKYGSDKTNRSRRLYQLFDRLVYSKVRRALGGRIRFLVSGGASLRPDIGEFFDAIGIPVLEGYGLTETSPVITWNRLESYRFGTVGPPLPRTHVKIAEDGEILVQGPGVMRGYYKNQEATAEVFVDGWFRTGDLGVLSEDGYLTITGRKKDVIVLSNGKMVVPQPIEEMLEASPVIDHAAVFGDGKKYVIAVIAPDYDRLQEVVPGPTRPLNEDERVISLLKKEIEKAQQGFAQYERVRKFVIAEEAFTPENELLTPTLKPRRHKIMERYREAIDKSYGQAA